MKNIVFNPIKEFAFLIIFCVIGIMANAQEFIPEAKVNADRKIIESAVHDVLLQQKIREQFESEGAIFESHIVERGESWESLARMSGIEESDLKYLNGGIKNLYTGYEITLVRYPKWSLNYERMILAPYQVIVAEAERHMSEKEWKNAVKSYSRIIDCCESLTAHYMRGLAYYNNGKFKEAAKDFSWVASNDKFKLYADASDLSREANSAWEQKKSERAEFWCNLAGTILQTGLLVASNVTVAKQMESANSTYSAVTYPSFGTTGSLAAQMEQPGYFAGAFNNLMDLSIQQVQQQQQNEYMEMRNAYLSMGKDLSWEEYLSIKAQAYAMIQAEEGGSIDGNNSGFQTDDYGVKTTSSYGDKDCHLCRGTGVCQTCNGSGIGKDNMFGTGKHFSCPNCYLENGRRTGKCSVCGGKGTRYGKM